MLRYYYAAQTHGFAGWHKGQKWNEMNLVRVSCADERTFSSITLGLRAGRGATGWRRMDGELEGRLRQTDVKTNSKRKKWVSLCGRALPRPGFLGTCFSVVHTCRWQNISDRTLAFLPSETLQAASAILSVITLSESVIPGMDLPNDVIALNNVFISYMN